MDANVLLSMKQYFLFHELDYAKNKMFCSIYRLKFPTWYFLSFSFVLSSYLPDLEYQVDNKMLAQ